MQQIVLLISDDINGRAIVKNTLEQHNVNVLVSENWQQCLASVPYIRPDLILIDIVDVHLSQGQRSDICRMLKEPENTKNIPLIFMVGPEETGEKIMALKAGAEDYISKPFQSEELAARVRVHLENRYLRKLLEEKRSASGEGTHQSGILLSDMSHDLRTPLNAIIGFTELLQQDPSLTVNNREKIDAIHRSGKHLSSLINDLVEICRLEAGRNTLNMNSFDLDAFIRDIERMIQQRINGQPCHVSNDATGNAVRFIIADRERLMRAIMDLAVHAARMAKSGGIRLGLRTIRDEDRYKLIGEISGNRDQDPGNAAKSALAREKTGEPKRSTGSQHDLIMGRELLRCMGGIVEVTGDSKGHDRIHFELNVREGSVQPVETGVSHRSLIGGDNGELVRVLVADDVEENRIVFTEILEHLGFDVRSVENGPEAVRQYEAWNPHIIMMDLRMPGMDGYEAARMIRTKEAGKDAVIFAATGDVQDSDREKIKESGMDGYILKPYDEETVREKIGEFVRISAASGRNDTACIEKEVLPESGGISELPHGLVDRMQDAARNARLDILLQTVDETEEYSDGLAERLRELIKRYDYESIFEILGIKQ